MNHNEIRRYKRQLNEKFSVSYFGTIQVFVIVSVLNRFVIYGCGVFHEITRNELYLLINRLHSKASKKNFRNASLQLVLTALVILSSNFKFLDNDCKEA